MLNALNVTWKVIIMEYAYLVIKLWVGGYGTITKDPFIAPQDQVTYIKARNDFINSKFFLIFSVLLIVVSTIYILLYFFRPTEKRHLSFSGITFFSSFFMVTVCIGEYPVIFKEGFSFLLYEKIFHGIAGTLSTHCTISFIRDLLRREDTKKITIARICITLANVILIL